MNISPQVHFSALANRQEYQRIQKLAHEAGFDPEQIDPNATEVFKHGWIKNPFAGISKLFFILQHLPKMLSSLKGDSTDKAPYFAFLHQYPSAKRAEDAFDKETWKLETGKNMEGQVVRVSDKEVLSVFKVLPPNKSR